MVRIKRCCYANCRITNHPQSKDYVKGASFIIFPKPRVDIWKTHRWLRACERPDFGLNNITYNTYLCSKHFVGGNGPTEEFPHPALTPEDHHTKDMETDGLEIFKPKFTGLSDELKTRPTKKQHTARNSHSVISVATESMELGTGWNSTNLIIKVDPEEIIPRNISYEINCINFDELSQDMNVPSNWGHILKEDTIILVKLSSQNESLFQLIISRDCEVTLKVFNQTLPKTHPIFLSLKDNLRKDLSSAIGELEQWKICCGSNESVFMLLKDKTFKNGTFLKARSAFHAKECNLLFKRKLKMCMPCYTFRKNSLQRCLKTIQKNRISRFTNNRFLTPTQLQRKLKLAKSRMTTLKRRVNKLFQ